MNLDRLENSLHGCCFQHEGYVASDYIVLQRFVFAAGRIRGTGENVYFLFYMLTIILTGLGWGWGG